MAESDPITTSFAPPTDLWLERSNLNGPVLSSVAYGILFTLAAQTLLRLLQPPTPQPLRTKPPWALVALVSALVTLASVGFAGAARFSQMTFIDDRNFPGGPNAFAVQAFGNWANMMAVVSYTLMGWLSDAFLIYRFLVFFKKTSSSWLAAIPLLIFLSSVGSSLAFLILVRLRLPSPSASSRPSLWEDPTTARWTLVYWSLVCTFNIVVSAGIAWRFVESLLLDAPCPASASASCPASGNKCEGKGEKGEKHITLADLPAPAHLATHYPTTAPKVEVSHPHALSRAQPSFYHSSRPSLPAPAVVLSSAKTAGISTTAGGLLTTANAISTKAGISTSTRPAHSSPDAYSLICTLTALLVESAALNTVWCIVYFACYVRGQPLGRMLGAVGGQVQGITTMLIVFRMAQGRAWGAAPSSLPTTTPTPLTPFATAVLERDSEARESADAGLGRGGDMLGRNTLRDTLPVELSAAPFEGRAPPAIAIPLPGGDGIQEVGARGPLFVGHRRSGSRGVPEVVREDGVLQGGRRME
ncbi:hypothetical protein C8R44DRAFT_747428 [Mycena epipterygia]|nr:hypothetical protein C8R44DRAFT_747428 [Mycena epipterygia]